MKKKLWWGIGIVLLVVCGVGGVALKGLKDAAAAQQKPVETATVTRQDLTVNVVETGKIEAVKTVEVKSRVAGRVSRLLVEESQVVNKGDLIAVIDPQETELRVKQDEAQLRGAQAAVSRTSIEMGQRRITARAAYDRAIHRLKQLEQELRVQPTLTNSSIQAAQTNYNQAVQARDLLVRSQQTNERASTKDAVDEANATLTNARNELVRKQGLYDKGYVSGRELDDAKLQVEVAKARLNTAQTKLDQLQAQQSNERAQADEKVKSARAELDRALANRIQDEVKRREYQSALTSVSDARAGLRDVEALAAGRAQGQASVDQLRSSLNDSRRQLRETEIRAPLQGIVTQKLVQEGELVANLSSFSAGTPIVKIEDRSAMIVRLNINEIDVAKLELGMEATVQVDALPKDSFKGRVTKLAPTSVAAASGSAGGSDQATVVRYQVEIRIDNAPSRLKTGMSAKCTVLALKRPKAIAVPLAYLGKDDTGYFVNVAADKPSDKPTKTRVKVGAQTGSLAEILDGVKEGQKLTKPDYTGPKRQGAQFGPDGD